MCSRVLLKCVRKWVRDLVKLVLAKAVCPRSKEKAVKGVWAVLQMLSPAELLDSSCRCPEYLPGAVVLVSVLLGVFQHSSLDLELIMLSPCNFLSHLLESSVCFCISFSFIPFFSREGLMAWQAVIRPRLSLSLQKGPCCLMRRLQCLARERGGCPAGREVAS